MSYKDQRDKHTELQLVISKYLEKLNFYKIVSTYKTILIFVSQVCAD